MAEDTDMTDVGARDDNPSTLNLNGNDTMTDLEYPTYPSSSTVICNADDALIKKLETDSECRSPPNVLVTHLSSESRSSEIPGRKA